MRRFLALAGLLAAASSVSAQVRSDFELELVADDFVLGERGVAQAFDYVAQSSGWLSVWASSSELDPFLRIDRADGSILGEDEDSGGDTTAWVSGPLRSGEGMSIAVAAQHPGELGRVRVFVRELPETDAVSAAVARATHAVLAARAALKAGESERSRGILVSELEAFLAVDGVLASHAGHVALEEFTIPFSNAGDFRGALHAATVLEGAMADLYPQGCRQMLVARSKRASMLSTTGETGRALQLLRATVEERYRLRGGDGTELAIAETALGQAYDATNDSERAAEWIDRGVGRMAALLPKDDLWLVEARANYGIVLRNLGELEAARALLEECQGAFLARFGPAHGDTLNLQNNLASVLSDLGDKEAALDLHRRVLAGHIALYGPDHEWVATSRMNVGVCLFALGETSESLEQLRAAEGILERLGSVAELADVRHRVALVAIRRGEFELAREEIERARSAAGSPVSEWRLASVESMIAVAAGDPGAALQCAERALALVEEAPGEEIGRIEACVQVAIAAQRAGEPDRARELSLTGARGLQAVFERVGATLAAREAEAVASARATLVSDVLALLGSTARPEDAEEHAEVALALVEAVRGASSAALANAKRTRDAASAEAIEELRLDLRKWTREVTRLSREEDPGALRSAVDAKERAERALRELWGSEPPLDTATGAALVPALAAALPPDGCAVGFWRYDPGDYNALGDAAREARLLAFAVRPDASVRRIELGPCAPFRAAIDAWRAAAASGGTSDRARASGEELRRALVDPLRAALGDARRWFVALDDALHALPLDALPDGDAFLGDNVRIAIVTTLADLLRAPIEPREPRRLVAVGGIDYAASGLPSARSPGKGAGATVTSELTPPPSAASDDGAKPIEPGAVAPRTQDESNLAPPAADPLRRTSRVGSNGLTAALRAGELGVGFAPLEGTAEEARAIATLFEQIFGASGGATLLGSRDATKAALERALEGASIAHVATHGFFAASDADLAQRERASALSVLDLDVAEPRQGFTALSRCGLALAGANRAPDLAGELAGVITAEELSGLDLSHCELVVLSACDTGQGYLRAGQGVSSFQKALHAAGARRVLTSLWRVGDLHTRELMLEFYRGLWERGLAPEEALWRAKVALRARRVGLRDWAGWVLSRAGG